MKDAKKETAELLKEALEKAGAATSINPAGRQSLDCSRRV